ncbi:MAG: NAD(P)-dependent oxidoreductase [Saprospiraceae bacterium]
MKNKTAFITGASRGIGKAIALRLAQAGANIVIAAKTAEPHPRLEGTIYSAAEEIEKAGGRALPLVVDIRSEEMVMDAVQQSVATFGGIDILINNASAIGLTPIEETTMKRYDLMHEINVRGTFMVSKYCIPHLRKGTNPHILTLSPPLNLKTEWFGAHLAYTMSKYGMSLTVLGQANQLKKEGIAANALWPQTAIATAAVKNILGGTALMEASRHPSIMADAAFAILSRDSRVCTGNFFIDETVLQAEGITDFSAYAVNPERTLMKDLFVE